MGEFREIVVIISGRGSNLKSLLENAQSYKIVGVLSNNPEAAGLVFASQKGIPTFSFARSKYRSLPEQKSALFSEIRRISPAFIVLAGYMQIVPPDLAGEWRGKLINIHPSLLPKYPGLDTHARAIADLEIEAGCSVHLVDEGIDTGAVIAQAPVPILPGDTPETLQQRVLESEHKLYPWVINGICCGEIDMGSQTITFSPKLLAEAPTLKYRIPHGRSTNL